MPVAINSPRSVDLDITNWCNLQCKYCSHFTSSGDTGRDLPAEEWLQFFEELNACATMEVCLCGGEPFFRKDIREIIEGIVRNRMRFSIATNGTLITDEMASFIASTRRCSSVQVSLDGSIATTHDAMRGEGSFKSAIRGVEYLRKHGVSTTVRVTIHKKNVGDLEAIAGFLLEEMALPDFSTNSACYMGLCRKNADQVVLDAGERTAAMATLLALAKKYAGAIGATAGPLAEARDWLEMERARREGLPALPGRGYLTGCNGPRTKMAVRSDGAMIPCAQLGHLSLGRINKDNLKEVWQTHPELQRLRDRQDIPLHEFEFCAGCPYLNYCTGGCPALAYPVFGRENHPSSYSCLREFLKEGGTLPVEEPDVSR